MSTTHTIKGIKGKHTGTLLECLEWQAEHQDALPAIDGADISDLRIAYAHDPHRDESDITPDQAEPIVRARMVEAAE